MNKNTWRVKMLKATVVVLAIAVLLGLDITGVAQDWTEASAQSGIDASRRNAIVQAIEKAAPAVVSINVVQIQKERLVDPFSQEFWDLFNFGPRYRLRERQLKQIKCAGSGFIFDNQGHVLTNYHVIEGAGAIASVTLADGRELEAELVGVDERADIAVLKVHGDNLPRADLGTSTGLMTGEWVIAIGNPFGALMKDAQPSVTVGVVSANHRRVSPSVGGGERLYQDMIQTDAAINPGNSGGPLVNAQGEVVGVNTMIFSPSGGNIGLGFALPMDRVRRVADEILQYGHRRDPWAGFKVEDISALREDFLYQLGVRPGPGCVVVNILSSCPAYEAGLRPGDAIVGVNGQVVEVSSDIDFALWSLFVGDSMHLDVERQGNKMTFEFPIQELN